ncbi:MAG: hypothetical protein EPN21_02870 [Methylococcaceae bacterium]|nr:MAG: hypothetical protein EPN21_02870 [Methylococcaceae bacterium]
MKTRRQVIDAIERIEVAIRTQFAYQLAVVRNLCAHHSRLWNREFTFTFKLPHQRPQAILASLNPVEPKKLYNTLTMLAYLLDNVSPGHHWKQRLSTLITNHAAPTLSMGFPADWQVKSLWK